ncbi:hypothetical protein CPB84DRAFT_1672506 [Gymnopilus junonius]|uniref:Uncharacterized protein n=1 Tax=Gymnopilus junonius TaxID=109634 RepID=A0A9P5TT66_GYMJU|nr:hypothetical protein CPB84DRAFT_1672506 [Gymnopilus junonius]
MSYDEHPRVEESQSSPVSLYGKDQQLHLPCHNVPGLWFVKLGLDELGTLDCKFDIDHNTAKKWNLLPLNSPGSHHTDIVPLKTSQKQLSLQICSFSRQLVDEIIQTHNSETAPEDIAKSIFALPQSWPAAGHLIITINPGAHNTRTWLPHEFGPNHPPIQIEDFVFEGNNIVQFIQLSGMPETIFALFAAERVKDSLDTTPLLPLQPANVETIAISIRVNAGSVSVLQLNS